MWYMVVIVGLRCLPFHSNVCSLYILMFFLLFFGYVDPGFLLLYIFGKQMCVVCFKEISYELALFLIESANVTT